VSLLNIPIINQKNKNKAFSIGCLLYCLLYAFSGRFHFYQPMHLNLSMLDKMVPFMPDSIWVYHSQFLLVFVAMLTCRDELRCTIVYYAILLAAGIAFVFFLLMPTELLHQHIDFYGIKAILWHVLYLTDTPANCFPSLHVALAILAARALMIKNKFWQICAPVWAGLICLSTLTTKQHYAVDVVGGIALATFSFISIKYLVTPEYVYENAQS
jgi:membrane-associated phospholipid phosphatase